MEDLTNWLSVLVKGRVLSSSILQHVWERVPLPNGKSSDFSLGWEFYESDKVVIVGHGGADTSEVRHFIHKATGESITVIWLSNTLGVDPHDSVNTVAGYFMKDIPQCSNFLVWQFNC